METRSRKKRDSDVESISSEPAITRSRSSTPFTLRSQCKRHGSECPEGHGIAFKNRLSPSPKRSSNRFPKKILIGRNGTVRRNLSGSYKSSRSHVLSSSYQQTLKPAFHTSDYSSGEEERLPPQTNDSPPALQTSMLKISPLQRSAEKTDFTYAKSYSYRTEVTPERVICMPNMTRRSIERCHGDGYSSPELRYGQPQTLFNSVKNTKSSNNYCTLKNGIDSVDHEESDDVNETYHLSTPSTSYESKTKAYSKLAISKLGHVFLSITWWVYLTMCYSLLLDTCVLQSRAVTKLRNFCHQQTKLKQNLPMMLLSLLLFFVCTGGLLYSASYLVGSHSAEKTSDLLFNPSQPRNSIPNSPAPAASLPNSNHAAGAAAEEELWKDIRKELQLTKDIVHGLQQQMNNHDGRVINLASIVDSYKGQLTAVEMQKDDCCDSIDTIVGAKINGALVSLLAEQTGHNSNNLEELVNVIKTAFTELDELKRWKKVVEEKNEKLDVELSQLENRMVEKDSALLKKMTNDLDEAITKWTPDATLFDSLKQQLLTELLNEIKNFKAKSGGGLTKEEVEELIRSALGTYDSDKTGQADYALEPAGGVVLNTRCTEAFNSHRPRISMWGLALWSEPNNPRVVIQPGIVPGQCWSFRGFDGYLVIQLSRRIVPRAFTLEHIPKSLAPDGHIDSAPRNFTVYGLTHEADNNGTVLGQYTYDSLGEPLQTFQVQAEDSGAFSIVELRIHSNHGNLNYTCLYRFRVHGKVASQRD